MTREDVLELIEINGLALKRQNKHLVFSDPKSGRNFVVAATTSDNRRAFQNQRSELKRFITQILNRPFLTERPKERREIMKYETKQPFNAPVVTRPHTPPSSQQQAVALQPPQEEKIQLPKIRPFDAEALAFCVANKGKLSQGRMAEELLKQGYTGPSGGIFGQSAISVFMKINGEAIGQVGKAPKETLIVRPKERGPYKKAPKEEAAETKAPTGQAFLDELTEILTSNLSPGMKETIILSRFEIRKR